MDGKLSDLTLGEVRSVLATIAGIEAEGVRAWMLIIEQAHDCGDQDCEAGQLFVLNSEAGEFRPLDNSLSLRLAADVVRSIAHEMTHP